MRLGGLGWLMAVALSGQVQVTFNVYRESTHQPLDRVMLQFGDEAHQDQPARAVSTDKDGHATIDLPPGSYLLSASRDDFGYVPWRQIVEGWSMTLPILPNEKSLSFDFPIPFPASISGTVRDERGDFQAGASVRLYARQWHNGRIEYPGGGMVTSDEFGGYEFDFVTPGTYAICVEPGPDQRRIYPILGTIDLAVPPEPRVYRRSCFPGDQLGEGEITIAHENVITQDLLLRSSRTADIQGHVNVVPAAHMRLTLYYRGFNQMQALGATLDQRSGEFVLRGVPPGKYRLETRGETRASEGVSQSFFSDMDLDVTGTDIRGLEITPELLPTLELSFEEESPGLAAKITDVHVISTATGNSFFLQAGKAVEVRPGLLWLQHRTNGACVTGAEIDGRDVFRQTFTVPAGAHRLKLRLSSQCAQLKILTAAGGKAAPASKVAFLLSGAPSQPGFLFVQLSDLEAVASVSWIAPGRYLVWAWHDDGSGRYPGPDLASVADLATEAIATEDFGAATEVQLLNTPSERVR
jgi:hypothetical protein